MRAVCIVYIHGAYPGDWKNIHDATAGIFTALYERVVFRDKNVHEGGSAD